MDRKYLIRIIEKNFIVLEKEELSIKIKDAGVILPQVVVSLVCEQSKELADPENLKNYYPYFHDEVQDVLKKIKTQEEVGWNSPLYLEKISDRALVLVSIYYHYPAAFDDSTIALLIQKVMMNKVLLV